MENDTESKLYQHLSCTCTVYIHNSAVNYISNYMYFSRRILVQYPTVI